MKDTTKENGLNPNIFIIDPPPEPGYTYLDLFTGLHYVADGTVPDSITKITFTVNAVDNTGATGIGSVTILPKGCPVVALSDSNIAPGDTIAVSVQGKLNDGRLFEYQPGTTFDIMTTSGTEYGSLADGSGITGDTLFNVSLPIMYIAADSIDADSVRVSFRAQAYPPLVSSKAVTKCDPKSGDRRSSRTALAKKVSYKPDEGESCAATGLTIGNYKLTIVEHSPWEIWPDLPPQETDGRSRGAERVGYNHKRIFSVYLLDSKSNVVPNKKIQIKTEHVVGSSGHHHTYTNNLTPVVTKQGLFYEGGKEDGKNPLQLFTKGNGFAVIDSFVTSEFSGTYLITASLMSDMTIKDTVTIQVRVPGLINFKGVLAETQDGQKLWDFKQDNLNFAQNHTSPYWLHPDIVDSIKFAAFDWYEWCQENDHQNLTPLSFNDMSLENGGSFDYPGTWNNSDHHSLHRIGFSVDINGSENYRNGRKFTRIGFELDRIMRLHQGKYYPEKTVHYGFNGHN